MSNSIEIDAGDSRSMPQWFDTAMPWIGSVLFHLGVALLVLFLTWCVLKATGLMPAEPPFGPTDVPTGVVAPYPSASEGTSTADAMARLNNMTIAEKAPAGGGSADINKVLRGDEGSQAIESTLGLGYIGHHGGGVDEQVSIIGRGGTGAGAALGPGFFGVDDGVLGGGLGVGPGPSGGPRASRIVYIIDHSGSLLENFDFLREELKNSVSHLIPRQQFAVVALSEDSEILGPSTLQHATADARRDLFGRIDQLRAQGENDGTLIPFQRAFEKAFALKPQLIYFLTDGAFDAALPANIDRLNAGHKVRINTLAFVNADPRYESQLKALAHDNGGVYKFIAEKDLGR